MNQFERLDEMLTSAEPGNAWGDDGVLRAVDVLQSFGSDDWSKLAEIWSSRPEQWQCFAADVLLDGQPDQAIPLLLDMIEHGTAQVGITACDSLRVLLQERKEALAVAPAVNTAMGVLATDAPKPYADSLSQLQKLVR